MEKTDSQGKGTIVLATVKGDVHDIGKNLVDIILTNNGYTVVNLGIKQPISTILAAAEEHRADAVGMSGLLVKSTVVMKENLQEMNSRGIAATLPGAARRRGADPLLRRERPRRGLRGPRRLRPRRLRGPAADGRDDGPRARHRAGGRPGGGGEAGRAQGAPRALAAGRRARARPPRPRWPGRSRSARTSPLDNPIPTPPFWGTRVVKGLAVAEYAGLRRRARPVPGPVGPARGPRRARARRTRSSSRPRAGRGCGTGWTGWPPRACCRRRPWSTATSRPSPRATRWWCSTSRGRTRGSGPASPSRASAATGTCAWPTSGGPARWPSPPARWTCCRCTWSRWASRSRDYANELFAKDAYRDYLEVHGLGVQLTEALAEYWHRRIREELTFPTGAPVAAEDPADVEEYFKLGYRGARYSLGYGACPNLDDRTKFVDLLQPGPHRRRAVRGAAAAPRAVHRRARRPPPGGQVLQCRLITVPTPFACAPRRRKATFMPPRRRKVAFLTLPRPFRRRCCGTWTAR